MYMDLNESGRLCWPAVAGRELRPINRSFLLLWSNTIDSIDTNANKNKKTERAKRVPEVKPVARTCVRNNKIRGVYTQLDTSYFSDV
jgi:hypothetical protein